MPETDQEARMAGKFVHAVDTRYTPARKVKVPEQHLDIFPYLKPRNQRATATRPAPQAPEKPVADTQNSDTKGGK